MPQVDSVGYHGELLVRQTPPGSGELGNRLADAGDPIRVASRPTLEPPPPTRPLGHANPHHNPRHTGTPCRVHTDNVGVKQERVHQVGRLFCEQLSQSDSGGADLSDASHADKMDGILRALAKLPVAVAVIPDFSGAATLNASVSELEGLPVIRLRDTPITGWHAVAKRAIDLCGAIVLLVVFGVPMLILALLVKLTSRGPVIFKQERMGLGGRPFMLLKFRSMRIDAETDSGPVWAKESDSRCTGIGAFMRRTSLDELPQLINILKGDMSLVGPRPERPHFVRQFTEDVPAYMLRHNVKAGLTGWAQVNGLRGNTSLRKRLQYDLYYIENWSFWFDVFILLMTPFSGLVHKNAY